MNRDHPPIVFKTTREPSIRKEMNSGNSGIEITHEECPSLPGQNEEGGVPPKPLTSAVEPEHPR